MDQRSLSIVTDAIDQASAEEHTLERVLLILIAILQYPRNYTAKAHPVSEATECIDWLLSAFPPISSYLTDDNSIQLSENLIARKNINDEGKYQLEVDGLFPPFEEREEDRFLDAEEMTNCINDGFRFGLFFSPFRESLSEDGDKNFQLVVAVLGLSLVMGMQNMNEGVTGILKKIIFECPVVADRFDEEDDMLLFQPDGYVRRFREGDDIVMMPKAFWNPIFEQWRERYPQMFNDS